MDQFNSKNYKDLLSDSSFVNWVKNPDKENDQRWELWMKNNPQRKKDVVLAREIILRMDFKSKYPSKEEIQESYHIALTRINEIKSITNDDKIKRGKINILKIAAVLLLFITSFIAIYSIVSSPAIHDETKQTEEIKIIQRKNPAGIRSKIILPDGSHVWLNAESELTYPAIFNDQREVNLKGEAFFQVVKDTLKPFKVKTRLSQINVLGTSFNVNAYEDGSDESISLIKGKVAVSLIENDTSSLLLPGEQILINKKAGISQNQSFDSLAVFGWTHGLLVFKNAGKDEIINKLSRWYGVKIEILNQPSTSWNVNGYFENQSLEMVLERLSFSKDFIYNIEGKKVKIKFN